MGRTNRIPTAATIALRTALTIALTAASAAASAQTMQGMGFTFTTDGDYPVYGYVTPGAHSGNYGGLEFDIALAEIDLSGLTQSSSATLSLHYASGALYHYGGNTPYALPATGRVTLMQYTGDNVAATSDYRAPNQGTVGSFELQTVGVGNRVSFDVTGLYNAAIARGDPAFGLKILMDGFYGGAPIADEFAYYDDITLTVATPLVPEPSTWMLMFAGIVTIGTLVRRQSRR